MDICRVWTKQAAWFVGGVFSLAAFCQFLSQQNDRAFVDASIARPLIGGCQKKFQTDCFGNWPSSEVGGCGDRKCTKYNHVPNVLTFFYQCDGVRKWNPVDTVDASINNQSSGYYDIESDGTTDYCKAWQGCMQATNEDDPPGCLQSTLPPNDYYCTSQTVGPEYFGSGYSGLRGKNSCPGG
jgi:hypothetical protein